jgi:hypothetical protein
MAAIGHFLLRRGAAICLLLAGAGVSATAQSPPARRLLAMNAATPYVEAELAPIRLPDQVPANVVIPRDLRALVTTMLRHSPTFRRQCLRIGRSSHLAVSIDVGLVPAGSDDAAVTRVVRSGDGRVEAFVRIGALGDPVTLIAHEFEHILEQIDGVDLAGMASRPGTGVSADPASGRYETERAIAAGQRAAKEVSDAGGR